MQHPPHRQFSEYILRLRRNYPGGDRASQLCCPKFIDRCFRRVRPQRRVPPQQHLNDEPVRVVQGCAVSVDGLPEQPLHIARRQRNDIGLQRLHILHPEFAAASLGTFQYLFDSQVAEGVVPFESDRVMIPIGDHFIVCRGHESVGGIVAVRQILIRYEPGPFVPALPGDRQQPRPVLPQGGKSGGVLADVALPIGIDDVFRGHFPARHSGLEFLPIACSIERKRSKISRCSRFRAHPAKRQCTRSLLP